MAYVERGAVTAETRRLNTQAFERFAVPAQDFSAVVVPVGEDPAFDVNAIDQMVVPIRSVGVPVDEGGIAVLAQEVVGRGGVEIHQLGLCELVALGGFALLAKRGGDRFPFGERFGEKARLPGRCAHLGAKGEVGRVVGA